MSLKDFTASKDPKKAGASLKENKRRAPTDIGFSVSPGGEVMTVLDSFSGDMNKAFGTKRKRFETFTSSSLQTSQQKVKELWRSQQMARVQMYDDYCTQFNLVFQQWEVDIQRSKDQDKKHMSLFKRQQLMFEQLRASQGQRLKTLWQLVDHYIKNMQKLQDTHKEQNTTAVSELRQEMALLHKKILMNTQQEEITSIRKALQSILM